MPKLCRLSIRGSVPLGPIRLKKFRIKMTREETISKVSAGIDDNRVSSLTQVLRLINTLSGDIEGRDIDSLVHAIGGDVSLSAKVLRAAQPMRYNPEGVAIDSIEQAVQMIGLEKICSISMALLMAKDMDGDEVEPLVVEILSLSIMSGWLARIFSNSTGLPNSELCFVSGLFQNYGNLLLAQFMPDEYKEACGMALEKRISKYDACRMKFGIDSGELAQVIFKRLKMPGSIWKSIRGDDVEQAVNSDEEFDEVSVAAMFSSYYSNLLNTRGLEASDYEVKTDKLISKFAKSTNIDHDSLIEILVELNQDLEDLRLSGGLPKFSSHLNERVKIATSGMNAPFPDVPPLDIPAEILKKLEGAQEEIQSDDDMNEKPLPSRVAKSKMIFHQGIHQMVEQALESNAQSKMIVSKIFETIESGFHARNIYFFVPSGYDNFFVSLVSSGPETESASSIPNFSTTEGSFLAQAVQRKEPVVVQKLGEVSREYSVPDWMQNITHLYPNIAWPLVYNDSVVALILMNGGDKYSLDELKIGSKQMNQFFKFATLSYASNANPSPAP